MSTKATIDGVRARLPAIRMALPEGVTLEPVYDQSDLVEQAVHTVSKALLEAFVLIVVVLMLFLMNLRASLLAPRGYNWRRLHDLLRRNR